MDKLKNTHLHWLTGFWLLMLCSSLLAACGDATTASPANTSSFTTSAATSGATTSASSTTAVASKPEVKPSVGFTAPDIKVKDINGQAVNLADYRGKVVLLNFWGVN